MRTIFAIFIFLILLVPHLASAGVTGKLSGLVIDKDTREALPGVNIVIEGTMQGAATDVNGFFISY